MSAEEQQMSDAFDQTLERIHNEAKANSIANRISALPGGKSMTPAELKTYATELADHVKPPGGIPNIPPLLEERRVKYLIPDEAFDQEAVYDRVLLIQVSPEQETYGKDSRIIMPETVQAGERESAPCGIIVSAGLKALDALRSNGMDVGHIVYMTKLSPLRIRLCFIRGKQMFLLLCRAGDIFASADLANQMREGAVRIVDDTELDQHVYEEVSTGKRQKPQDPWSGDDM